MADNQKKRKNITCKEVMLLVNQLSGNQKVIGDTKGDRTSGICMAGVIGCKPMMSFYLICIIE